MKLRTKLATTVKIILANAVLHNIAIKHRDEIPDMLPEILPRNVPVVNMQNINQRAAAERAAFIQQHFGLEWTGICNLFMLSYLHIVMRHLPWLVWFFVYNKHKILFYKFWEICMHAIYLNKNRFRCWLWRYIAMIYKLSSFSKLSKQSGVVFPVINLNYINSSKYNINMPSADHSKYLN